MKTIQFANGSRATMTLFSRGWIVCVETVRGALRFEHVAGTEADARRCAESLA